MASSSIPSLDFTEVCAAQFLPIPRFPTTSISVKEVKSIYSRHPNSHDLFSFTVHDTLDNNIDEGKRRLEYLEGFLDTINPRYRMEILAPSQVIIEEGELVMIDLWRGDLEIALWEKLDQTYPLANLLIAIPTKCLKAKDDSLASVPGESLNDYIIKGPFEESYPEIRNNTLFIKGVFENELFQDCEEETIQKIQEHNFFIGSFPIFLSTSFDSIRKQVQSNLVSFGNKQHSVIEWSVFQINISDNTFNITPNIGKLGYRAEDITLIKTIYAKPVTVENEFVE